MSIVANGRSSQLLLSSCYCWNQFKVIPRAINSPYTESTPLQRRAYHTTSQHCHITLKLNA